MLQCGQCIYVGNAANELGSNIQSHDTLAAAGIVRAVSHANGGFHSRVGVRRHLAADSPKNGAHKSLIVRIVRAMNFNSVRGTQNGPGVEGRPCLENRPVIVSDSSDMAVDLLAGRGF